MLVYWKPTAPRLQYGFVQSPMGFTNDSGRLPPFCDAFPPRVTSMASSQRPVGGLSCCSDTGPWQGKPGQPLCSAGTAGYQGDVRVRTKVQERNLFGSFQASNDQSDPHRAVYPNLVAAYGNERYEYVSASQAILKSGLLLMNF